MSISPYFGKNFFEFFAVLFGRLIQWMQGDLSNAQLASDEIQLLVLIGVAFSSALVGAFLVLKRMTMLANSLSHTILLGIVIAYVICLPFLAASTKEAHTLSMEILFLAALLTGLLTTLLTHLLTAVMKLQEDASIGLVFTTLFALGVVLVTVFTRNAHIGTEVIMGNVDALHLDDLKLVFAVGLFDFFVILFFFKEFKMTTFDPGLAKALGISIHFFNYLLMVLVAATCIAAFRAIGVLLVLAYLVGPVLAARLLTASLKDSDCYRDLDQRPLLLSCCSPFSAFALGASNGPFNCRPRSHDHRLGLPSCPFVCKADKRKIFSPQRQDTTEEENRILEYFSSSVVSCLCGEK